eukprot:gene20886-32217_t
MTSSPDFVAWIATIVQDESCEADGGLGGKDRGLYDAIARVPVADVKKQMTAKQHKINRREKVKEIQWTPWKQSYQPLLLLEVWRAIVAAMEEQETRKEYTGELCSDENGQQWYFRNHGDKLRKEQMSGMVFLLSDNHGRDYSWFGVFQDPYLVILNSRLAEGHTPGPDGVMRIRVKVKLLISVISDNRRYKACGQSAASEPPFCNQLMGAGETLEQLTEPYEHPQSLNASQESAVQWWVRKGAGGPKFMLLQGPPGTGKTTTAVEILHRSIAAALDVKLKRNPLTHKIVCAAPSWTAVYQYAARFMPGKNKHIRVAMTGCNDRTRSAAEEPEGIQTISVAALAADIQQFVHSLDKTKKQCKQVLTRIKQQAPAFYEDKLAVLESGDYLLSGKPEALTLCARVLQVELHCIKVAVLREATVVFATLNALAASHVAEALGDQTVDTLIVDEAGQASDPDLFIGCGLLPERLLLIGDHRQLPPMVMSPNAKAGGLHYSSLERLYSEDAEADHRRMLTLQYRMPPEVLAWPNKEFYEGKLKSEWTPDTRWDDMRYRFIDVYYGTQDKVASSFRSFAEAAHIVSIVMDLQERGADLSKILIITPYAQQRRLIEKYVSNYLSTAAVRPVVTTIDGCQGAEQDHVIVSLVRTEKLTNSFAGDAKHLCVALTRAKQTLAIVGNADKLQATGTPQIKSLVRDAKARKVVTRGHEPIQYAGEIVWPRFIAHDGTLLGIGELGHDIVHGDKVQLELIDVGVPIVMSVEVTAESTLRQKVFACQLVNDGNVCFHAPSPEDREAVLRAVREIATNEDGHTCNGHIVKVADRQPTEEGFLTLTMPDTLLAEQFMTGKQKVMIPSADSTKMKEVPASIPREPYYHKFIPIDDRLPLVRIQASEVVRHSVSYRHTVIAKLTTSEVSHQRGDGVSADIVTCFTDSAQKPRPAEQPQQPDEKSPDEQQHGPNNDPDEQQSSIDWWMGSLAGGDQAFMQEVREAVSKQPRKPADHPQDEADTSGVEVLPGEAFTIDEQGTTVFDDAVSCEADTSSGGWTVKLIIADPTVHEDMLERLRTRMTDIRVVNKVVRMMPHDVLTEASLAAGSVGKKAVVLTFTVAQNGAVTNTGFTRERNVHIRRNFRPSGGLTWEQFEAEHSPGPGPTLLKEAVSEMMTQRRFFDEALYARAGGGPHHMLAYIVACAKRSAAEFLGTRCTTHPLFHNSFAVADETKQCREAELLRGEGTSLTTSARVAAMRANEKAMENNCGYIADAALGISK